MAFLILIVVGIVVGQTWLDWRDAERRTPFPAWASGLAMAAVLAASLTTTASLASILYRNAVEQLSGSFGLGLFWPELGFLLCAMGIVVAAMRKKRARTFVMLAGLLTAAFWLGLALAS
jgi:hypothetical protein